ncbi:MAG: right-handed parallel beta-helix repeat-containing protein [candidate division WOR-3 bacterium]|nr:right-handed parallel beta-helix repeat-containing protein [candidate division WOR-3 bacterium]
MNRNVVAVLLLCLLTVGSTLALVLDVPSSYPTIQAGINAAAGGDTVLVAPATYYENINFRGKNIMVASNYLLSGSPGAIDSTIINGGNSFTDTGSCVLIVSGEDSTAKLEGFTITRGTGTLWTDEHSSVLNREGGGVLIALSSPVIRHNIIVDNSATNRSGATGAGGGGIRVGDGNPLIEGNVIMLNNGRYGAGIVLNHTGARIRNNIIFNNRGGQDDGGGGILVHEGFSAAKVIENNTIVGNSASTGGGGMRVWDADSVVFRNNIVWGNVAATGDQLDDQGGSARVTFCDVKGGWPGNIAADPEFARDNFYLTLGSPCVDAGNPDPAYNDPDSSGVARWPALGGRRNDMGAYGGPRASVLARTFYGISEQSQILSPRFGLTVQPQPCRTEAFIRFELHRPVQVSLSLYDATGRRVKQISTAGVNAGGQALRLGVAGLPAGGYVCRLAAGGCVETVPMVVAK